MGRVRHAVVEAALRNLWLENLRKAVDGWGYKSRDFIEFRYTDITNLS